LGCDTGALQIQTAGDTFIEGGPADAAFVDGGGVVVSKFLVVITDAVIQGDLGDAGGLAAPVVIDIHQAGPHEIFLQEGVAAGAYPKASVSVGPADDSAIPANASVDDTAIMADQAFSVLIEGQIRSQPGEQNEQVEKTFSWGLRSNTRYVDCTLTTGEPGVEVPSGAGVIWTVGWVGARLFSDDLSPTEAGQLRVQSIIDADRNDDGVVDTDELVAVDLEDVPAGLYNTRGASTVVTLFDFIEAQSGTMVRHSDGGPCTPERR
jgi:hypothetical protein